MNELHWLSAVQAAALIRQRKLSPTEYLEAQLARIEALQPSLNCFTVVAADLARQAALDAEKVLASGAEPGPLLGVPIVIEDLFDVAGLPTTHCSVVVADYVPPRDEHLVARLKAAGAIVVGKTTMSEFGHKGLCDSPLFGSTPNPWNPAFSAGGASGGSASALATGQASLGLSLDGGCGTRLPAVACGLVGLKPTLGLVPYEKAEDSFSNKTSPGPQSRTVADAALMLGVLASSTRYDPWSTGPSASRLKVTLVSDRLDGVRIGFIPRMANLAVAPDVLEATKKVLRLYADHGADVEEITDSIDWIESAESILHLGGQAATYSKFEKKWGERMDPVLRNRISEGHRHTLIEFRQAQFQRTQLFQTVQKLFDRYDFLLSPAMPTASLPVDFNLGVDPIRIAGTETLSGRVGWVSYMYPFTLTGHPALALPSGFSDEDMPMGFQLVGPWSSDMDLLRLGAIAESHDLLHGRCPPV